MRKFDPLFSFATPPALATPHTTDLWDEVFEHLTEVQKSMSTFPILFVILDHLKTLSKSQFQSLCLSVLPVCEVHLSLVLYKVLRIPRDSLGILGFP